MTSPASLPPAQGNDDHWKFLRDVLVFQLKMLLDNVRDFALMPVSLVAALIDLIFKGERQGALFYQVLKWGAHSERVIDVYSAIEEHEKPGVNPRPYGGCGDCAPGGRASARGREGWNGGQRESSNGSNDRANPDRNERTPRRCRAGDQ